MTMCRFSVQSHACHLRARRSAAVELSPPMLVGHALPPWDARGRSRADGVVRSREKKGSDGERWEGESP